MLLQKSGEITPERMTGWNESKNSQKKATPKNAQTTTQLHSSHMLVKQALWDGDGQGNLACCSPWGREELDTTEWLNWTEQLWSEQSKSSDNLCSIWSSRDSGPLHIVAQLLSQGIVFNCILDAGPLSSLFQFHPVGKGRRIHRRYFNILRQTWK